MWTTHVHNLWLRVLTCTRYASCTLDLAMPQQANTINDLLRQGTRLRTYHTAALNRCDKLYTYRCLQSY